MLNLPIVPGKVVRHSGNQQTYEVIKTTTMKEGEGSWVSGVNYKPTDSEGDYTRDTVYFLANFEEV